jgi:hypothetical protein
MANGTEPEEEVAFNGLYCFLDHSKECGMDCMAFTDSPAESPGLSSQQKNCVFIVSAERAGRYLGTLVKLFRDFIRDNQPAPPGPMGS